MIGWCLLSIFISLAIVTTLHLGFLWISDIIAPPRIVDLVDAPNARYEKINHYLHQFKPPNDDVEQMIDHTPSNEPISENTHQQMKEILQNHLAKYA